MARTAPGGERVAQAVVGVVGVAAAAYGGLLLLDLDGPDLLDALLWLAGGVVLHDAVVAPLTVLATLALRRVLPSRTWTAVTVGLVVLLTVTATAVPVLGRFGARPDNPTLLDRDYTGGWLVLAGLVVAGTLAWSLRPRGRVRGTGGTTGPASRRSSPPSR
ncbi:hypothetical protein [Nocardioides aurantiacus]|uniref:Uncharacterized protein n=1 Tax=Nocardioides aurantiacus TaxID=86796 RepID=A0A3N2CRB7_9ACTN|nr:hypothetical protein [Nocardioides aurantiacus]ROR90082.1 hypothetical protein EDD33_0917 [Nocardioides aurantiacus]